MKLRPILLKGLLVILSLLFGFIVVEIGFRILLFNKIEAFNYLRNASNYADSFSDDDFWKLEHRFGRKSPEPHPELGWISANFSGKSYIHNETDQLQGRRPVLLYGDSFAGCSAKALCFEDILNSDEEFSKDHYLLNYGVGSYGVDQIYLLYQNSVQLYDNPYVIVSLMTFDLDRSILSVRSGQKPYFEIDSDSLVLKGIPIYPNPETFFSTHPPQITSYTYRRLLYGFLPSEMVSLLRHEKSYIEKKKQVNAKIIQEMIRHLRDNNIEFVFLIFHPHWPGVSTLDAETDWRDPFLRQILSENQVPYIWSKQLFQDDILNKNYSIKDYIILEDGHPTSHFNMLISEEIKNYVLNTPY